MQNVEYMVKNLLKANGIPFAFEVRNAQHFNINS